MSNNGADASKAAVPFGPKLNGKSEAGNELDRAGHAILGALHQAAGVVEAKYQQANRKDPQIIRSASSR